jgi:hypothetical protein
MVDRQPATCWCGNLFRAWESGPLASSLMEKCFRPSSGKESEKWTRAARPAVAEDRSRSMQKCFSERSFDRSDRIRRHRDGGVQENDGGSHDIDGDQWAALGDRSACPWRTESDYPRYLIEWCLQGKLPPANISYRKNVTCRRVVGELTHLSNLRAGPPPHWPMAYPNFWAGLHSRSALPCIPNKLWDGNAPLAHSGTVDL